MGKSAELEELDAALSALRAGKGSLGELETLIKQGLSRGNFTRRDAGTVIRSAAGLSDAASSSAILRLLDLDEMSKPLDGETRLRSPTAPEEARSGTDLKGRLLGGRYLLDAKLGEGGMGFVYVAHDREVAGETFAIKVLKPEIRALPEALDLVREEVRKTRSLAHPNIVGMYSVNIDQSDVFILMEYLVGKPLNTLLDEDFGRGMPFDRAWPCIQDVCAGLAHAHDHSVVHSDLKPSNIFLTNSGRVKLLDFGIARAARGGSGRIDPGELGALTPAYASCEMLEGGKPDQRDDVYSLGCVVYEMLSGKLPFHPLTAVEARDDGLTVPKIKSLSDTQNAALAAALAFDRESRTQTVEALLAGLDRHATSPPAKAGIPTALKIGAAATILLLAVAGVFAWRHEAPTPNPVPVKVTSPPKPAGPDALLSHVQTLIDTAGRLEVDPSDPSLEQGTRQAITGRQRVAAGNDPEGDRILADAEQALVRAVRQGNRLAHTGSTPDQIAAAISLCTQAGNRCSASDFSDEAPRTLSLPPFEIDPTEVSNREFSDFATTKNYVTGGEREGGLYVAVGNVAKFRRGESWKTFRDSLSAAGFDPGSYPVRGVDFKSAGDYCASQGKRLPSEAEWEYVARGPDQRIFAWGNEPRTGGAASRTGPLPVGEQPATGRFGSRGLGDGVLEWVDGGTATARVLRGSSWLDTNPVNQRLAMRRLLPPPHAFEDSGFRCARAVDVWAEE